MPNLVPIGRALISVSDKSGLIDLSRALAGLGVELISTGGTSGLLRAAGLAVRDVAEVTGFPEMMGGRVKTLHPNIHGALLALRDDDEHLLAMAAHGIEPIDLLISNLYPFEETVAKGADPATCIENIDIGGPAMIRAAAKNHRFVTVVTDPADYGALLDQLRPKAGGRSYRDQITYVTDRPGHDRRYAIDASKIEQELGWRPAETFDTGIRKTVQWYLDNSAWVENVQSGGYRDWIQSNYLNRPTRGATP